MNNLTQQLNDWQAYGFGNHSTMDDPLFADYANDNFTLLDNSPAFDLGFEQIDMGGVGPRTDCFDDDGCSVTEQCIQKVCESIATTSTPVSSQGGGGSSSASTASQTKSTGTINAGETKTVSFTKDFGITEIDITVKDAVSSTITIKDITSSSSISSSPIHPNEGAVYKYLSITAPSISQAMEKAVIKFKVTNDWLNRNNFDENTVELKRQNNGGWESLPTKKVSSNTNHAHYEAETTSFSKFAIVGKKKVEEPKAETEQLPPTLPTTEETIEETKPKTSFYKSLTWLWVTLLIITILSVAYFLMRKN
jgi:PGF-pre-PGF domain-containing protein